MSSSNDLMIDTTDTHEEVAAMLKHYGREAQASEPDKPSTDEPDKTDQPDKAETPAPAPTDETTVDPPAEVVEEKGKTAADQEPAKPQEQETTAEPVREDFDSEEKFDEAHEDWKDKQKPKGDGGWQKRIDRLTKKLGKSEAAREELRRQVDAKSSSPVVEKPAAEPAKPEAAPKPKVEEFETYELFGEALADWKITQRLGGKSVEELVREQVDAQVAEKVDAKVKEVQAKQEAAEVLDAHIERLEAARLAHDDFNEVTQNSDLVISEAMEHVMMRSEEGAEMGYYFGNNPEECERIARLSPFDAARALGKLEATLAHERKAVKTTAEAQPKTETPAPAPPKPKTSAAPPPIRPVKTAAGTPAAKNPGEMSPAEYNAWRAAGGGI